MRDAHLGNGRLTFVGCSALLEGSKKGNVQMLKDLLSAEGLDTNELLSTRDDIDGSTALM